MVLPTSPVVSPLRLRMLEDMRMRQLNGKTQVAYIRAVRRFAGFLGRSPDTALYGHRPVCQVDLHVMSQRGTGCSLIFGLGVQAEACGP